jgi:hypothetical protein
VALLGYNNMKATAVLIFAMHIPCSSGFYCTYIKRKPLRLPILRSTPEETRNIAVQEFLRRTEEDKLQAIEELSRKKAEEIAELKRQVKEITLAQEKASSTEKSLGNDTGGKITEQSEDEKEKLELLEQLLQAQERIAQFLLDQEIPTHSKSVPVRARKSRGGGAVPNGPLDSSRLYLGKNASIAKKRALPET